MAGEQLDGTQLQFGKLDLAMQKNADRLWERTDFNGTIRHIHKQPFNTIAVVAEMLGVQPPTNLVLRLLTNSRGNFTRIPGDDVDNNRLGLNPGDEAFVISESGKEILFKTFIPLIGLSAEPVTNIYQLGVLSEQGATSAAVFFKRVQPEQAVIIGHPSWIAEARYPLIVLQDEPQDGIVRVDNWESRSVTYGKDRTFAGSLEQIWEIVSTPGYLLSKQST